MNKKNTIEIWVFLFLTFLLSSIFWYLIKKSGSYYLYMTGLMWSPGIAGILTRLYFKESLYEIGFEWKNSKWILGSFIFPLLYLSIGYGVIWIFEFGGINFDEVSIISNKLGISDSFLGIIWYAIVLGLFGMGHFLFAASGEELGWRGFFLKKLLISHGAVKSSIIVGFIWAIWHWPLFHINGFSINISNWLPFTNFTIMVISLSFVYTKFYLHSRSIWTSIFLHTSHNLFLQRLFNPITKSNEITYLYSDETGFVLMAILMVIVAIMYLGKTSK